MICGSAGRIERGPHNHGFNSPFSSSHDVLSLSALAAMIAAVVRAAHCRGIQKLGAYTLPEKLINLHTNTGCPLEEGTRLGGR